MFIRKLISLWSLEWISATLCLLREKLERGKYERGKSVRKWNFRWYGRGEKWRREKKGLMGPTHFVFSSHHRRFWAEKLNFSLCSHCTLFCFIQMYKCVGVLLLNLTKTDVVVYCVNIAFKNIYIMLYYIFIIYYLY